MSIAQGIYALLQSKQPLTELVGSNVMPLVKAQQLKTPCIVYAIDNVTPNHSFTGGSLADTYAVSFHVFDKDYDKAVQIARVLRNTIGYTCGKFGGWDFRMVRFENIEDSFQDAGQLYGQTVRFTVRVKNDPNFGLPKILRATFTEVGNLVGTGVNVYPLQLLVNEQGYLAATALVAQQLQSIFTEQGGLSGSAAVQELFKLSTTFSESGALTGRAVGASFEMAYAETGNLTAQAQLAIQMALVATEQSTLFGAAQSSIALVAQFAELGQLNAQAFSAINPVLPVVESGVFVGVGEVVEGAFDPDYQAVLDYATAQGWTLPSTPQQTTQNAFILELKAQGIWSRLDVLWVPATNGDVNFAGINWKSPGNNNFIRVNSPVFTANSGFQGNGTSSFIRTQFNPFTQGVNVQFNDSASFMYITQGPSSEAGAAFGSDNFPDTPRYLWGTLRITNTWRTYFGNVPFDFSATPTAGLVHLDIQNVPSGASNQTARGYQNGVQIGADRPTDAQPFSNHEYYLLALNRKNAAVLFSTLRFGVYGMGSTLNDKAAALNTAITNYITAL